MPRKIIILERQENSYGLVTVRGAFWVTVEAGDEVPKPSFNSQVLGANAPNQTELDALRAGEVIEYVFNALFATTHTNAEIRAHVEKVYNSVQAATTANPPGEYYGSNWDGTSWIAGI